MSELGYTMMLLGAGQGAILSVVLARREQNRLANRILAALVAGVALMLVLGFIDLRWGRRSHPHLLALGAPLPYLFAPLQWLYVVALTRPLRRLDARQLVHGVPFVAYTIFMTLAFYSKSGAEKTALAQEVLAGGGPTSVFVMDAVQIAQALAYLGASFAVLRRYRRRIEQFYSDLHRIDLRWLTILVGAHTAVWSIVAAHFVLRVLEVDVRALDALRPAVAIGSALFIFVVGYISLWQRDLFRTAREARSPGEKYQRNRLDEAEARELVGELEKLMTDKELYRDGSLTSQTLADALGVTPHLLSQVLNVHVGKSFYSFVNGYRVEALMAALEDPAERGRGVLELALDAGFNSKSTVNSVFKKQTGMTPTQFRASAAKAA
jgi:AraC-like DNA-binding protein